MGLVGGAACGAMCEAGCAWTAWLLPVVAALAGACWRARAGRAVVGLLLAGFAVAGLALASDARANALRTPLREVLDTEIGGFAIDGLGPASPHEPIATRLILDDDASVYDDYVSLRGRATALRLRGGWRLVDGGIAVSVAGSEAQRRALDWTTGRRLEAPLSFRRPTRYLDDGVPDFERDLALDGTTLLASAKSGLLVEVEGRGSRVEEAAAVVRAHVRRRVARWVAPHDRVAAAIVVAVLVGDRTGLPERVRDRLQAAGTYHVIAISGGNIAIITALVVGALRLLGLRGRAAGAIAIVALLGYAQVASSGPSVWRATLMALLYLAARAADHRSPSWHTVAAAAAAMIVVRPLDVRDPGFLLTFGATAALVEMARHVRVSSRGGPWRRVSRWVAVSGAASLAVGMALLPVSAATFSRITWAGLALNLVAVPAMAILQVAGIATVLSPFEAVARAAGWVASAGAEAIVSSSALVDALPWLAVRVPPPGAWLVAAYYAALAVLSLRHPGPGVESSSRDPWLRIGAGGTLIASMLTMVAGVEPLRGDSRRAPPGVLRWTMFDVGQGEAMLVEFPDGRTVLIDSGGLPFGGASFDVGARVLAPALWARGVRRLDALLITHGDPDHVGGAGALLRDFTPRRLWHGIPVPTHEPTQAILAGAARRGVPVEELRAGGVSTPGGVRLRVLHPPVPDWERRRVRNDDSVVVELVYGEVAFLLTGDVGADTERALAPQLTRSAVRVLKVAHHGSRTSTSAALVERWRPQVALISCGRGNTFGHPSPDVLGRLASIGARVLRTDRDGQITVETDGRAVRVRTYGDGLKAQGLIRQQ
jgi:competence protein ComEC